MTNEVARRKVLGLVGLGLRGRLAVVGVQQVRDAAKRGKLKVALVASDASKNSLDKVSNLLKALEIPVVGALSSTELGGVAGRESVACIGVTNAGLARGIMTAIPAPGFEATAGGRRAARPSSRGESRR